MNIEKNLWTRIITDGVFAGKARASAKRCTVLDRLQRENAIGETTDPSLDPVAFSR